MKTEIEKLKAIFNTLTNEQKNQELLYLPYEKANTNLSDNETISIKVTDTIKTNPMFLGYSGVVDLLRVINGEVVLKPKLIKETIECLN